MFHTYYFAFGSEQRSDPVIWNQWPEASVGDECMNAAWDQRYALDWLPSLLWLSLKDTLPSRGGIQLYLCCSSPELLLKEMVNLVYWFIGIAPHAYFLLGFTQSIFYWICRTEPDRLVKEGMSRRGSSCPAWISITKMLPSKTALVWCIWYRNSSLVQYLLRCEQEGEVPIS